MAAPGAWADLRVRVVSALALVAVGSVEIWLGGWMFEVFAILCAGLMIWELARMARRTARRKAGRDLGPMLAGGVAALAMAAAIYVVPAYAWLVFLAVPAAVFANGRPFDLFAPAYAYAMMFAVRHIVLLREESGVLILLWLVLVVVASDVMGYFAGRMLGGPKFWPAVSPKKTWSGTIAGWIGAGLVGYGFVLFAGAAGVIVFLSMVTAFAGQMGDIAESALKRQAGIKDSSNLIPGHGGLLDRFDALAGAAFFLFAFSALVGGSTF